MRFRSAARSEIGQRAENQDRYRIVDQVGLFVVADGVGGRAGGGVAAALTVETIADVLLSDPLELELRPIQLLAAVEHANRTIYRTGMFDLGTRGMGSTCVAALACSDHLAVAHVGDSRAYRIRNGKPDQLTRDHTVAELVRDGVLLLDPTRRPHAITRALGSRERVEAAFAIHPIVDGDRFVLCTDGLTKVLDEAAIGLLASASSPGAAVDALVSCALERGATDNVTAVVVVFERR